jgi:hypothetical protein
LSIRDRVPREREAKLINMVIKKNQAKAKIDNSNSKLEGQVIGCSEIFTLDNKGNILKKEWKCEEVKDKNWKW